MWNYQPHQMNDCCFTGRLPTMPRHRPEFFGHSAFLPMESFLWDAFSPYVEGCPCPSGPFHQRYSRQRPSHRHFFQRPSNPMNVIRVFEQEDSDTDCEYDQAPHVVFQQSQTLPRKRIICIEAPKQPSCHARKDCCCVISLPRDCYCPLPCECSNAKAQQERKEALLKAMKEEQERKRREAIEKEKKRQECEALLVKQRKERELAIQKQKEERIAHKKKAIEKLISSVAHENPFAALFDILFTERETQDCDNTSGPINKELKSCCKPKSTKNDEVSQECAPQKVDLAARCLDALLCSNAGGTCVIPLSAFAKAYGCPLNSKQSADVTSCQKECSAPCQPAESCEAECGACPCGPTKEASVICQLQNTGVAEGKRCRKICAVSCQCLPAECSCEKCPSSSNKCRCTTCSCAKCDCTSCPSNGADDCECSPCVCSPCVCKDDQWTPCSCNVCNCAPCTCVAPQQCSPCTCSVCNCAPCTCASSKQCSPCACNVCNCTPCTCASRQCSPCACNVCNCAPCTCASRQCSPCVCEDCNCASDKCNKCDCSPNPTNPKESCTCEKNASLPVTVTYPFKDSKADKKSKKAKESQNSNPSVTIEIPIGKEGKKCRRESVTVRIPLIEKCSSNTDVLQREVSTPIVERVKDGEEVQSITSSRKSRSSSPVVEFDNGEVRIENCTDCNEEVGNTLSNE